MKAKIIKKALKKILPKGTPIMEVSDKEYKKNLEEYVVKVTNEDGSEIIVPSEQTKKLAKIIFSDDLEKYRQVNGSLNDEGSKIFCQRINDYLDKKGSGVNE